MFRTLIRNFLGITLVDGPTKPLPHAFAPREEQVNYEDYFMDKVQVCGAFRVTSKFWVDTGDVFVACGNRLETTNIRGFRF